MSDDVLVKVDNVSKRFCRSLKRSLWYGLQDLGSEIGGRRHGGGSGLPQSSADVQLRPDEFWALKDVSFELRRGECLGLIGRNGAGKTTLLRMLNGLIKPDTGRIEMKGQVGALIALGAGFNPLLTGRENIEISASILGMSKQEVKNALDEIISFSEIGEFINSPVQTYSSGMQARLGFAVASTLEPSIILIDEVLAVGDTKFRLKCHMRIQKLISQGCSAILVSHNPIDLIRVARYGLVLNRGLCDHIRPIEDSLLAYEEQLIRSGINQSKTPAKNKCMIQAYIPKNSHAKTGQSFMIMASLTLPEKVTSARLLLQISDHSSHLCSVSSFTSIPTLELPQGKSEISVLIKSLDLVQGTYNLWIDVCGRDIDSYFCSSVPIPIRVKTATLDGYGYGVCHTYAPKVTFNVNAKPP